MSALKLLIVELIVFSACLTMGLPCQAQDVQGPSTNGCGSGWSLPFVPNRVRLANCEFEASCNSHDRCYGQCTSGGALLGTPVCDYLKCRKGGQWYRTPRCDEKDISLSETAAGNRRLKCDQQLGADIANSNLKKPVCEALGWVYREAVSLLGNPNFSGVGTDNNQQSKVEYEQEIRNFLANATDQQLEDFSRLARTGKSVVDLTKPVKYKPGVGLINKTSNQDEKP